MMIKKTFIGGAFFSGTTVLSGLMQNIPDVFCPGELDCLLPWKREGFPGCNICLREDCSVIEPLVQWAESPGADHRLLPEKALEFSGASHVVCSDKKAEFIQELSSDKKANLVTIFKHPLDMALSWKRRSEKHERFKMEKMPEDYQQTYRDLEKLNLDGKRVFVLYDDLISHPTEGIQAIAEELGLTPPVTVSFPPPNWHNINGNRAFQQAQYNGKLRLLNRWVGEMTQEESVFVLQNTEVFYHMLGKRLRFRPGWGV